MRYHDTLTITSTPTGFAMAGELDIAHRLRAAHHRLTICQTPPRVRRVFALAGPRDLLEPTDDLNNTIPNSPAVPQPVCSAAAKR